MKEIYFDILLKLFVQTYFSTSATRWKFLRCMTGTWGGHEGYEGGESGAYAPGRLPGLGVEVRNAEADPGIDIPPTSPIYRHDVMDFKLLPDGVRIMILGGFIGYSFGSLSLP